MSSEEEKDQNASHGSSYLEQGKPPTPNGTKFPTSTANHENEGKPHQHRTAFLPWLKTHFTFSWFTCTQSTGGISILLSSSPKTFPGLTTIGTIIFLFNIALVLLFTFLLILRWKYKPNLIRKSFTTPPECYFFGSFWLTLATMIINIEKYGTPHTEGMWLVTTVRILFWLYAGISLTSATVHMVIISKYVEMKIVDFPSPAFILILNAMLTGTCAGAIAGSQPVEQRVPIMVAGVAYQGLGWIMCVIFLTFVFGNLLERGWPVVDLRGGELSPEGVGFVVRFGRELTFVLFRSFYHGWDCGFHDCCSDRLCSSGAGGLWLFCYASDCWRGAFDCGYVDWHLSMAILRICFRRGISHPPGGLV